jgi:NAD-dependent SIR2 family protein deacetylase
LKSVALEDRIISLGPELAAIPERLLLAHARGDVLFICGAGVSMSANLPDFRELVMGVYEALDSNVHAALYARQQQEHSHFETMCARLNVHQLAEVKRFAQGDYDVVLGMLERRLDNQTRGDSRVRREVTENLRSKGKKPAAIHTALMRLADRGGASTIVTTNFDTLLEAASKRLRFPAQTYSLGSIPRPTKHPDFSGVHHIHGVLDPKPERHSELVLSDQDFGEFYLRRRTVPDFIYDAARLFHLVLVGYSASDPPMRYLLNAVAADGSRFEDLKERFTFLGTDEPDLITIEDWRARGITPIPYSSANEHVALRTTLERWADLSPINGRPAALNALVRRIVKTKRNTAAATDRDLFDHLFRRGSPGDRIKIARLASEAKADTGWLDAMLKISVENERRRIR